MNLDVYVARLRLDAERVAEAAATGPLDAQVSACPDWDLRQLVTHCGMVHRTATFALVNGRRPEPGELALPTEDEDLASWFVDGAATLVEAIEATPPDAETWHPFPSEQVAGFWARRMANETAMHRWDAEVAVTGSSALDPEQASDGIDEYFERGLPRVLAREQVEPPAASLHVHCTDVEGEWLVRTDGGYAFTREHAKGDAALRGPAESLLLVLMGRAGRDAIDIVGDPAAADAWLSLPGW